MSVQDARDAETKARMKLDNLTLLCREEANRAADKVREKWAAQIEEARNELAQAARAHVEAQDTLPDHEWEGRRVFREYKSGPSWNTKNVREEGIVETFRSTSKVPTNMRWGIPQIGEPIVRAIKKDGTPALKFEKLHGWHKWELDPASGMEARQGGNNEDWSHPKDDSPTTEGGDAQNTSSSMKDV